MTLRAKNQGVHDSRAHEARMSTQRRTCCARVCDLSLALFGGFAVSCVAWAMDREKGTLRHHA
ncbi:hypothetical protein FOMPIDRAFT_124200 [Fomitopsis schrenkii]|uniref:Uncharacterized protein n=1 Tax=Fomitopsis schrenkii TaxID=2126942 RepID=S8E3W1_FOMSC|nr:hypothetical protein FOMPIDRAFT_124200 [Fomitopsis schrenkii]